MPGPARRSGRHRASAASPSRANRPLRHPCRGRDRRHRRRRPLRRRRRAHSKPRRSCRGCWFRMGGVSDVDAALAAGGWYFRTVGDGQVLLPWGATEKLGRKIDATDPETSPSPSSSAASGHAGDRPAARRGAGSSATPTSARSHATSASPRAAVCAAPTSCHATTWTARLRRRRRHHRPLDQVRCRLRHPVPLAPYRRGGQSPGRRPVHLRRSPHPSRHQGDSAVHGDRRGRRYRRRAGGPPGCRPVAA